MEPEVLKTFMLWMDVSGSAVDPLLTGTGIHVSISTLDDAGQVTTKIVGAINGNNWFANNFGSAAAGGDNHSGTITLNATIAGAALNIDNSGGIGTDPRLNPGYIVQPTENFYFSTPTNNLY